MMHEEDAVEPQEEAEMEMDQQEAGVPEQVDDEGQEEAPRTQVPLHALQKEREKRKEAEIRAKVMEEEMERLRRAPMTPPPPVDDSAKYESATREDLHHTKAEAIREIKESLWIEQNPEYAAYVNENLAKFLKQKPNYASAINSSANRYQEAYTLMDMFAPKPQKQQSREAPPKKVAPNAPTSVPKAAALREAVDVMTMSDAEYNTWRQGQRRRR